MAYDYGVSIKDLKLALESYRGVKRRFTYHLKTEDKVLIDDYAHHPSEIKVVKNAVRELYPNKKVTAIFQPHLFSRTQDFADDFAKELSGFDELLIMDIYPARELPIEGVTSGWLLEKVNLQNKSLVDRIEVVERVKQSNSEVFVVMGAGDISNEVLKIKEVLV